jgi:orotate phosphoribosyltransferase
VRLVTEAGAGQHGGVNSSQLAAAVLEASHLSGDFVLRSGARSSEYFDKYRFESDPGLLGALTRALTPLVPPGTEALAGLELGGVPLATALSAQTGLPALFVRKQAKTYGTCRLAEGGDVEGRRLLVVEDVVTSGGQVVTSCGDLRRLGAEVSTALCVIDRQSGGAEALGRIGVELRALFTMEQLRAAGSSR